MPIYTVSETVVRWVTLEADSEDDARERYLDLDGDQINEKSDEIEVTEEGAYYVYS